MRSIFRTGALAGSMLVVAGAAAAAQQPAVRVAYVNPQAIFENAPGRAEAQAVFAKEAEGFRAELSRMNDGLTQLMSDYQKNESKYTPAEKERRQRAIAAKQDSLRGRQDQLADRATQRQSELMAPIMEAVRKVLEDIRVEDGYSMIFSNEPGASPILVADKNLDITERVVARLKTVAATKPATAPVPQKPAAGAPASAPSGVTRPKPPGT